MKSGTVEINHSTFILKLKLVGDSFNILKDSNFLNLQNFKLMDRHIFMQNLYENISTHYDVDVVCILSYYYNNIDVDDEYTTLMISQDYEGKLEQCISYLTTVTEFMHIHISDTKQPSSVLKNAYKKITNNIKYFNQSKINIYIEEIAYNICICGTKMDIHPESSSLICSYCGVILNIGGVVFEDTVIYTTCGHKSIQKCYDPSKHCREWVQRIQASENIEISKEKSDKIMACLIRDNITHTRQVSCSRIRSYLKETRNTEYNDHVPAIRLLLTGIKPPQLSIEELRNVYNLFDKSIRMYAEIKPSHKSNTLYYPYILYKILDILLKTGSRKQNIMECIHLQSRDTLIVNDNIWMKICENIPMLTYRPTDRSTYT